MALDYVVLKEALETFVRRQPRGAAADLARRASVDPTIISRIINGKTSSPSLETWVALHTASPENIPPPAFDEETEKLRRGPTEPKDSNTATVPVFGAAGGMAEFTDLGYPVGVSDSYVMVAGISDPNAFAVRITGDSMEPTIMENDVVVVSPAAPLEIGRLCFATWPQDGVKTVKRYFVYGKTVVLRPDNPCHAEIALDKKRDSGVRVYRIKKLIREL